MLRTIAVAGGSHRAPDQPRGEHRVVPGSIAAETVSAARRLAARVVQHPVLKDVRDRCGFAVFSAEIP